MLLKSTAKCPNFCEDDEQQKSLQLVVNTINFNNQDLADYINISEEIERNARERRCQRKRFRSRCKTSMATMTREEIFESTNIDDDRYLEALEHETSYEAEQDHAALVSSIENIMKYFDEDVSVRDEILGRASPLMKLTKGKVASAVATFCKKYGLSSSSQNKKKIKQTEVKPNIQELRKKYETSTEIESSPSAKAAKSKIPKLTRKTKVKQMALLFNNKINSITNSSSEPQTPDSVSSGIESLASPTSPICTTNSKPSKVKTKFPSFVTKLPSPKPSPFLKRKQLQKSASITSFTSNSPLTKRRQKLANQPSRTCLVAESVFAQLSVKDKALLYNKFIADLAKQNPKFSKHAKILESNVKKELQRGEVVFEKQCSVKHLRERWEAKLTPNKNFSKTLQRSKTFTSKFSLDAPPKSKEYEDIQSNSHFEDDSEEELLHVSNLTVILKSSPETNKGCEDSNSQSRKKHMTFDEDINVIQPSCKRTQSMIRASFCVEPLAPPKKIRRTGNDHLAPDTVFQNQHLEKLFYYWLKEKNGVAFDITTINNRDGVIEILPKSTRGNTLPPHEVEQILDAAMNKLESSKQQECAVAANKNDAIVLIKNTIENEKNLDLSVIEVELPLEDETPNVETNITETEDSDLGLAAITKTTTEDSQMEFKSQEVLNETPKLLRKKKLRRPLPLKKENSTNIIFSTDSDSDSKAEATEMQSCTLPKSKKCSNYIKKLLFKTLNSSAASEHAYQLNNNLELLREVNSPSKIKNAYTLTIMTSPSPPSGSDVCEADLPKTPLKEASRSWPSLVEAGWVNDAPLLKDKFVNTNLEDFVNIKIMKKAKAMMESFIDQGFETGSNETAESPLKLSRKANQDYRQNFSTPLKDVSVQHAFTPETGTAQYQAVSPIAITMASANFTPRRSESNTEDTEEKDNTPSTTNESASLSSHDYIQRPNSSQFWITSGQFTAAITIHHYQPDRLMLLSNIYMQKSAEFKELNFGIDDQKFCFSRSAIAADIIENVPKETNCSQYWFSTGNVLIPFRGQKMTKKKIRGFFSYIREFMDETCCIRFGIDDYEFSYIRQQRTNSWTQTASPLKTSDLGQSDIDLESYEQSPTFSALESDDSIRNSQQTGHSNQAVSHSLEQISPDDRQLNFSASENNKPALASECTVPEMINRLQNQQNKLKLLEERMTNFTNNTTARQKLSDIDESHDYMKKLQRIITTIDSIGRGSGFHNCTIEQLESFIFLLSHYADLCLANCSALIENILKNVMSRR